MCCEIEERNTHKLCLFCQQEQEPRVLRSMRQWVTVSMVVVSSTSSVCSGCSDDKHNNKKSPPEHENKGFKPCCLHGKHTNHSCNECHANLHKQAHSKSCGNNNNNKRRHYRHHHNNCYTSSNDESRKSTHTSMLSNGGASASNKSKVEENFHLSNGGKILRFRRLSNEPSSSCSRKSSPTKCPDKNSDIDLDWDDMF